MNSLKIFITRNQHNKVHFTWFWCFWNKNCAYIKPCNLESFVTVKVFKQFYFFVAFVEHSWACIIRFAKTFKHILVAEHNSYSSKFCMNYQFIKRIASEPQRVCDAANTIIGMSGTKQNMMSTDLLNSPFIHSSQCMNRNP